MRLVRRNLKYAVRGGIDDGFACGDVLRAVVADNIGARIGPVAQASYAGRALQRVKHTGREAVRIERKAVRRNYAAQLPVTDDSIFTRGRLGRAPI
jgi:hypothetical protein